MIQNPEKPPEINFNAIKAKVADKTAVESLEKAYKALSVNFPGDNNVAQQIAAQEREHKERGQKLIGRVRQETKEAHELIQKFEDMIPYDQMHPDEFVYTFPDWSSTAQNPSVLPDVDRVPGLSKKQYKEASDSIF